MIRGAAASDDLDSPMPAEAAMPTAAVAASGWRGYVSSFLGAPLAVALALVAVLLPAVLVAYAYADDYSYLWMAVSGEGNPQFGESVFQAHAINGRPLTGLFVQAFFGAAETIDHLRFVRAAGVGGVVALGLFFQWALVRSGVRPWAAAAIAVFLCTMPAFQVYGGWTVLFGAPYAAILAGAGSVVAASAADRGGALDVRRVAGAAALLLGGLFIYQPAAMCFWVFLAIAVVGAREEPRRAWRLAWVHGAVAFVSLAVAYAQTRLTIAYYGDSAPEASRVRAELSYDVIGRAKWFVEQPLYQSLNLWNLDPSPWVAVLVAGVATGGLLLWTVTRTSKPLLFIGIALALVPLSYLPNLAIKETQYPFRTQAALSSLIALYLALGAVGAWLVAVEALRRRLNAGELGLARAAVWSGGMAVVVASCLYAASNVSNLIAGPQSTELRMYRGQVQALAPRVPRISFVFTSWYGGLTDHVYSDEYGVPTTSRPFALLPSFKLLLEEEGRLSAEYPGPWVDWLPADTGQLPANQPAVDLRGMGNMR